MQPEINEGDGRFAPLQKVTPLYKYLSLVLFIALPFIGGWIGYMYAPEMVVESDDIYTINQSGQFTQDEISNSLFPAPLSPDESLAINKSPGFVSTTTLQIDLSGLESRGERDVGGNTISTLVVNITGRLVVLDWTVTLEAYEPSHLFEMAFTLMNERSGQMVTIIPASGFESDFSGVRVYSGSFDLASYSSAIDFIAGDTLSVQLWETYDDLPGHADGLWKKGVLTAVFEYL